MRFYFSYYYMGQTGRTCSGIRHIGSAHLPPLCPLDCRLQTEAAAAAVLPVLQPCRCIAIGSAMSQSDHQHASGFPSNCAQAQIFKVPTHYSTTRLGRR